MTLYLLRGLPGAGKSTLAKTLARVHFESDMYFTQEGEYNFDKEKLPEAHEWCYNSVRYHLATAQIFRTPQFQDVVVSNTFTTEEELAPYLDMARVFNCTCVVLTVENYHGSKSIHNVPDEIMDKMEERFKIKLR